MARTHASLGHGRARRRLFVTAMLAVLLGFPVHVRADSEGTGGADFGVSGEVDDRARVVWDVLFWRPVYVVQLVGGVAMLPVALPVAAASGDWKYGLDVCVQWPYEMAFERPLGQ